MARSRRGADLPVRLQHDPVAQLVLDQGLVRFTILQFPGQPGVADGGQRRSAGAAVVVEIRIASAL